MKTRRTKRNKSPQRPFPTASAFVAIKGDMIMTRGVRGRTIVKRIVDKDGKRIKSARFVAPAVQLPAPVKGRPIFVGRVYTGAPRGKTYPTHGPRRHGAPITANAPAGFLGGLLARGKAKAKQVLVGA